MRTVKLTKESTKDILENLLKRSPNNYGKFESTVAQILDKVKNEGDAALFAYTKEFDKTEISADTIKVTEEEIKEYQHKVKEIVENSDGLSTPQVAEKMDDLRRKIFGNVIDYTEIKQHYNQLMLDYFPYMKNKVDTSEKDYSLSYDNLAIPEIHKKDSDSEKDDADISSDIVPDDNTDKPHVTYDSLAVPEVHFRKNK